MTDFGRLTTALAEIPETIDAEYAGPTAFSNWVIRGCAMIGPPPQGGALSVLLGSGVTCLVDVRDGAIQKVDEGGCNTVRFVLDITSYPDRGKQRAFLYYLCDLMADGECLYIFDSDGHLKCGLVAACLLAGLYQFQPVKALNKVNQLHGVREKTEGFDCPRTTGPQAARVADLRAYVKDMQTGWAYVRGAGASFLRPISTPSSPPRGHSRDGSRPPSSRCKNSGGGETSFDFRGGVSPSFQPRPGSRPSGQQVGPNPSMQPGPPVSPPIGYGVAGGGHSAVRELRVTQPTAQQTPQISPRPGSSVSGTGGGTVVNTHMLQRQGGSWGFSLAPAVIVTRVDPHSPAALAGVRAGTVLLAIDGTPVDCVDSCAGLLANVDQAELAVSSGPLSRSGAM
eukprot:Hpha_TRINITY_DN27389_c0_g1::TRINITY_DN27389_c0_g1_i1::g.607::m.607